MSTVCQYATVNRANEYIDVFDNYDDALECAESAFPNLAVVELQYEYVDSDLAWDPYNDGFWPPEEIK